MSNREKAKELREKNAGTDAEQTQEALASAAEGKHTADVVTKLQADADNIKAQLQDVKNDKEELEVELDTLKARNAELEALHIKHDENLEALKQDAVIEKAELEAELATVKADKETLEVEFEKKKKELTALKSENTKLKNAAK